MKYILKGLGIILAFCLLYVAIMLAGYQYLYPYPVGYLDRYERDNKMLQYRLVQQYELNSETTLYFTREKNGTGKQVHVGTLKCDKPKIIRNFFCETTSAVVFPINSYGYATTSDGINYLFGQTTDMNTVAILVTFFTDDGDVELKLRYAGREEEMFYLKNFDMELLNWPSMIEGLNEDDGICFSYSGPAFTRLDVPYISSSANYSFLDE